jgi:hypothetical protein
MLGESILKVHQNYDRFQCFIIMYRLSINEILILVARVELKSLRKIASRVELMLLSTRQINVNSLKIK